jgi:hypothetical protein
MARPAGADDGHAEALEFEQAAELRNRIGAVARAAPAVGGREQPSRRATATWTSWPSRCRAAAPASTWPWCAAAGTWATAPTSRPMWTTRRAHRTVEDETAPRQTAEVQVLEAFIAQHYIGQAVPPVLLTSHPVDKGWRTPGRAGGRARARAAPAARAAPHLAGDGREGRRSRWRGCWPKKARSSSARARWWRRWTWTPPTWIPAHRVLRHQPHGGRSDAGILRGLRAPPRCRAASTGASTSRASPAATTTPPCARC